MRKQLTVIAALLLAAAVNAQSFHQAFFLDGYRLGYRYNPAMQNPGDFLSVGQFESQTRQNFGAASFLYPRNGEVVTGLHSSVSAEEFLASLEDVNYLSGNINYNIVSYGWRRDATYHTLEANVRAMYSASFPRDIFTFLKLGNTTSKFNFGGLGLGENAVVELAYGWSHNFSDIVSIGVRAKVLVGLEALSYRVTRMDMTFSDEVYRADIEADLDLTSGYRKIRTNEDGYFNLLDLSAKDRWTLPSGAGLAADLGIVVTPFDGFTLSASVLDLGGMFWYYGNAGKSQGTVSFNGVKDLSVEDIQNGNIKDQFSGVLDDLLGSVNIKGIENRTSLDFIPFNVNAGIKYKLPFYKAFSFGVTGNYISMKEMSYKEVRGSLAWNPWSWLGITGSGGIGNYGPVWSAAANVALGKFRLTAGYSDGFGGTVPYTGTPLTANNKILTVGLTCDL